MTDPDLAALAGLQAAVAAAAAADAAVAALVAVVRDFGDVELGRVGLAGLGEALVATERLCRRTDAARLLLIGEHDRRQGWKADGARSAKEWLAVRCGLTRGEAAGQVQTASVLPFLPATTARLAAGRLTPGQARAAAATARRVAFEYRAELDAVVAGAVDGGGDTTTVRTAVDGWAHRLDQRLLTVRADHAHQQRRLTLTRSPEGGAAGEFRLDPIGAETVRTALDALSAPTGEADRRTAEQRRADALVTLARRTLDRGDTPVMGGERPHVTVIVPLDTLTAPRDGTGTVPATLGYGGPASGETARLLACDASVSRVVMAGASVVLDAGRSSRLVSAAQRRALAARDQGCRGCNAPPAWCQAHHIIHWAHGGTTNLTNLVLLCGNCHDAVHHRNWQLTRNTQGLWDLHPPRPRHHSPARNGSNPTRDRDDTSSPSSDSAGRGQSGDPAGRAPSSTSSGSAGRGQSRTAATPDATRSRVHQAPRGPARSTPAPRRAGVGCAGTTNIITITLPIPGPTGPCDTTPKEAAVRRPARAPRAGRAGRVSARAHGRPLAALGPPSQRRSAARDQRSGRSPPQRPRQASLRAGRAPPASISPTARARAAHPRSMAVGPAADP